MAKYAAAGKLGKSPAVKAVKDDLSQQTRLAVRDRRTNDRFLVDRRGEMFR